jgi:hypothetical protein
MDVTNYKCFEIDIADIYAYEKEQFLAGSSSKEHARDLMDLVHHYVIKNTEPNFGISIYDNGGESGKAYYERRVKEYIDNTRDLTNLYELNYFIFNDGCYDYDHEIIVKAIDENFPYFFSLKLKQYKENLFELNGFLTFQLKKSFNNNTTKYKDFLNLQLLQYPALFSDSLKDVINNFKVKNSKTVKPVKAKKHLDKKKPVEKEDKESFKVTPSVWQYALFYVYIISSNEHKGLHQIAEKRKDAFAKLAARHNLSADSFEQKFDFYIKVGDRNGRIKSGKRTCKTIRDDIQFVVDNMLTKYPKALVLAQTDLREISAQT